MIPFWMIRRMRRWGVGWRRTLMCAVGWHSKWRPVDGRYCARCGAEIAKPSRRTGEGA